MSNTANQPATKANDKKRTLAAQPRAQPRRPEQKNQKLPDEMVSEEKRATECWVQFVARIVMLNCFFCCGCFSRRRK